MPAPRAAVKSLPGPVTFKKGEDQKNPMMDLTKPRIRTEALDELMFTVSSFATVKLSSHHMRNRSKNLFYRSANDRINLLVLREISVDPDTLHGYLE